MPRLATLLAVTLFALPAQAAPPSIAGRVLDRDESRAQAKAAADELARLKTELSALDAARGRGEQSVRDRGEALRRLNAAEAALTARSGANRAELSRLLAALQMFRRNPPPALLVSPKEATDAVNAAILLKALTPELERRARAYAAEARTLAAVRRRVALQSGALFSAESDVADRRAEIQRDIQQKSVLEQRLNLAADRQDAELARLDPDTGSGAGRFAALQLLAPVSGGQIVRRYGDPWPGHAHSEGWAWRTAPAAQVLSPATGRVDFAGELPGLGLVLILRAAGGYHLVLAGLQSAGAAIGSDVSAGQAIGRMPAAIAGQNAGSGKGRAAPGPELYLEVRKGETPQDPAHWLGESRGR